MDVSMSNSSKSDCIRYVILSLALSVASFGLSYAGEVYKCKVKNESGETVTVFSYAKCGDDSEKQDVRLSTGPDLGRKDTVSEESIALAKSLASKVRVGDSCEKLSEVFGAPTSFSVSVEEGREVEHRAYMTEIEAGAGKSRISASCYGGEVISYGVSAEKGPPVYRENMTCEYWKKEYQKGRSEYLRMMSKNACENDRILVK